MVKLALIALLLLGGAGFSQNLALNLGAAVHERLGVARVNEFSSRHATTVAGCA
jgi:hypothetical protein